jgi:predicted dehydrogenase
VTPFGALVIGAGDMGARHAQHWAAAGVKVVAVYDPDTARAEAVAGPLGAEACTSPAEPLRSSEVQAVSVCTPTFLHTSFVLQALEAGKHVLCEKPVALKLEDALAMKAAVERSGRELRIGFMRRFDPAYEPLLEGFRQLGTPVLAQATIAAGVRPKRLMHDADANGGPVVDMCCHIFDLWETLFAAPAERVSARGYTFCETRPELTGIAHKALDSAQITLEYPGGVGQVLVSWGLPPGVPATERHTYMGPEGLLTMDWNSSMELHAATGVTRWETDGADPWQAEIAHFYRELTQGAPRRVASLEDGISALRVSLAVLESISTGQPVPLAPALA